MNVREVHASDDLEALLVAGEREGFPFLARLARERASGDYARSGFLLLGVFTGATPLGVGGITPDPYIDAQRGTSDVGRIRHVYVLPEARRRGVARLLLSSLVVAAPPVYRRLRLRTLTPSGAALYRVCGFADTDEPDATHTLTRPGL